MKKLICNINRQKINKEYKKEYKRYNRIFRRPMHMTKLHLRRYLKESIIDMSITDKLNYISRAISSCRDKEDADMIRDLSGDPKLVERVIIKTDLSYHNASILIKNGLVMVHTSINIPKCVNKKDRLRYILKRYKYIAFLNNDYDEGGITYIFDSYGGDFI